MSSAESVNECHPSFVRGLWALTHRELKKWLNDPVMLVMFVLQPLIWMGLLGKSMNIGGLFSPNNINLPQQIPIPGTAILYPPNLPEVVLKGAALSQMIAQMGSKIMEDIFGVTDYFSFMAVGMISMIVVTTTMFSGMSIVWDRRLGFLDKVISTPVSRAAIIFSKILNATFRAMFQATVILALAYLLGLKLSPTFTPLNLLGVYAAIFLLAVGLSSVFIAFSIRSTRMERPMQFVSLITMPLMFASNTFFPTRLMPDWMQALATINPLTYLTDAMRHLTILPMDTATLIKDFTYLGLFAAVLATIGTVLAWKYLTR
ncbi:MAG: ABC transporter permease [Candidatus Nanoarchaeia archaeon]|nr:ABC transporter permease [Candidatus Haiyanarchaeum thermophilum]MCW1303038.1 ABC transporter permease [Candidatus Haiyanarchaeum thermophilum]MCW1303716.1 ABC transporter permease [Candidatus Haiyanarchaeum thermophilum]MCW1307094.1 ABC transporter permease [Candidatus Haiyanarchaeum thermophilum]MCW1307765.1 ABC transporter permease [Candidatus Haiyanarchaeum thermophilum]